ncbi:unnamed protein product [Clonostachys rosea]|uniref:Uncharacterized protein n=1 Tax=Bionectria ochroleuca TaxID=29856 RepID=A0ABY6US86_BIOOC|nr:unnamed protein product [Clonostachys rosea]
MHGGGPAASFPVPPTDFAHQRPLVGLLGAKAMQLSRSDPLSQWLECVERRLVRTGGLAFSWDGTISHHICFWNMSSCLIFILIHFCIIRVNSGELKGPFWIPVQFSIVSILEPG